MPSSSLTSDLRPPTSDQEVLVRVEGVSKKFCRDLKKSLWYGVKDVVSELLPIKNSKSKIKNSEELRPAEFWAVTDVSFELRRGECLGLIGSNGAGKTTLLKMLNGLIKPDAGSIEMRGRVGAIIALGAGFNPILTGRENIYVNGSIIGLTKSEIEDKMEEIIDFSEVREFIDSPVQSYSSGMAVRLGFAVATSFCPDVLLLDEVLAVGDANFRKKCYEKIAQIQQNAAIIFVSHQLDSLRRLCTLGLFLKSGRTKETGAFADVADAYEKISNQNNQSTETDYLSPKIESASVRIERNEIQFREAFTLVFRCRTLVDIDAALIRLAFATAANDIVAEWSSANHSGYHHIKSGVPFELMISIASLSLKPGTYKIILMVSDPENSHYLIVIKKGNRVRISGPKQMVHCSQI